MRGVQRAAARIGRLWETRHVLDWTIVIPIKGTPAAKSRLGGGAELALAIALDTVDAARQVGRVIVVTAPAVSSRFAGVQVIADTGHGLAAAIRTGLAAAGSGPVAVMLGDLPALQPAELREALALAEHHDRAMVPDSDGQGTTLITALVAADHAPAFGPGSRAAHRAVGYIEIDGGPGLRSDVDTPEQLSALAGRLGTRTASSSRAD